MPKWQLEVAAAGAAEAEASGMQVGRPTRGRGDESKGDEPSSKRHGRGTGPKGKDSGGRVGVGGGGESAAMGELCLLIEQMEARLREVEHISMTQVHFPQSHGMHAASVTALKAYAAAVRGKRGNHGQGSPHLHVAARALHALGQQSAPSEADAGYRR